MIYRIFLYLYLKGIYVKSNGKRFLFIIYVVFYLKDWKKNGKQFMFGDYRKVGIDFIRLYRDIDV